MRHFVHPLDDFVTIGSLYRGVVNPLFIVARRGEAMLRRAALSQAVAINRTIRAKIGLPWSMADGSRIKEKTVPPSESANSCYTLGKEVPPEALANTKNHSFRFCRYGNSGRRQLHLLHEISLPGGAWRRDHVLAELNFTFAPHVQPPRLGHGRIPRAAALRDERTQENKGYGKARQPVIELGPFGSLRAMLAV